MKDHKKALESARTLSAQELAAGLPQGDLPKETPQTKVIQGLFKQQLKQHQQENPPEEKISDAQRAHFQQGLDKTFQQMEKQRQAEAG